ncbi:MAG: Rrf2 family transcriptional regulator [Clostridiales bacterium]|nr:Rrf2 family transcriptional regulator [Clostridiales bacterium]
MRISARGRYALAATISMAARHDTGENITVVSLSESLGISKIYLEQVFSLLKKAEIVSSQKGAQGGYRLSRLPQDIPALAVLSATDLSLFEEVGDTVKDHAPGIEAAMRSSVFDAVDGAVRDTLNNVTLKDLADEMKKYRKNQGYMYFI